MESDQPLTTKRLHPRCIPLGKNPLVHNKGSVNILSIHKFKLRAKGLSNCSISLNKLSLNQSTIMPAISLSINTDPTPTNKLNKEEVWPTSIDSVPSKSIAEVLPNSRERYLKLKEEVKLEANREEGSSEAVNDVHLARILEYRLKSFTPAFRSMYAKDLKLHSRTFYYNLLDKKTLCLEIQNVMAMISSFSKPDADEIVSIENNGKEGGMDLSINYRPYLWEFLDDVKSKYELIVYSRLSQAYTTAFVNAMQKKSKYFSHVCHDEFCLFANLSCGVKFIDFLCDNRAEKDIVVVDTAASSLPFSRGNFVAVSSFDGTDCSDQELIRLAKLLDVVYNKSDVISAT